MISCRRELQPEQMEHIYSYLEGHNIDVVPVMDDSILSDESALLLDDDWMMWMKPS